MKAIPLKHIFEMICPIAYVLFPLLLQAQGKEPVTETDYGKWGYADLQQCSADGRYCSYSLLYESGRDTLFIKAVAGGKPFPVPGGQYGKFSANGMFACYKDGGIALVDPQKGRYWIKEKATRFSFSQDGAFLAYTDHLGLHLCTADGTQIGYLSGVTEFSFAPVGRALVCCITAENKNKVLLLENPTQKRPLEIVVAPDKSYATLRWAETGIGFVFTASDASAQNAATSLYAYLISEKKLRTYTVRNDSQNPNMAIAPSGMYGLYPSRNLERVFIGMETVDPPATGEGEIQVFNAKDSYNYIERMHKNDVQRAQLALWKPFESSFSTVTAAGLPWAILTGADAFAILGNPATYEPQFDYNGPMDLYLKDLGTGKMQLLLQKQESDMRTVLPSPGGGYIAYYRDAQWSLYDLRKQLHIHVSKNSGIKMADRAFDMPGIAPSYGFAGWTEKDESFIVYDEYDLWQYHIGKKAWVKLTDGRSQGIRFRVSFPSGQEYEQNYYGWRSKVLDMRSGLLVSARKDRGGSGFYFLKEGQPIRKLVLEDAQVDQVLQTKSGVLYRSQRFDTPISINLYDNKVSIPIVNTNPHHHKYAWGYAEPVFYSDSTGRPLKGVVFYPPGYVAGKKYPMIVHIYEKQFQYLHTFGFPSAAPGDGFNTAALTLQGYVVFFPDIEYEIGHTGASALHCTTAGVYEMIRRGIAEPAAIGLMGHSFGGYETNYIIAKTNIFAAAVSGAGASDLCSFYHSLNWDSGRPDMWRMEYDQWRIGQPFSTNQNAYNENSPITYAADIVTPLLAWAGKRDHQVSWLQGIEYYLALRRLNKEHIFLLYRDEGHNIDGYQMRKDLFAKTSQWFAHYLRTAPAQPWMARQ